MGGRDLLRRRHQLAHLEETLAIHLLAHLREHLGLLFLDVVLHVADEGLHLPVEVVAFLGGVEPLDARQAIFDLLVFPDRLLSQLLAARHLSAH